MLTKTQSISKQWPTAFQVTPPVYMLDMTFCNMECSFGQFRSAVLNMLPPIFLWSSSLAEHDTEVFNSGEAVFSNSQTILVISTLFSSWIQNTELYEILRRKWTRSKMTSGYSLRSYRSRGKKLFYEILSLSFQFV